MLETVGQQVPDNARSELDLEEDLNEEELQRKKIARRLGLGTVLIVVLLAVLFLTEYLNQEEPTPVSPPPPPVEESAPQTIGQSVTGPVTPVTPAEPEPPKPAEPTPPKVEEPPPPPPVVEPPQPAPRLAPRPRVNPAPRNVAPAEPVQPATPAAPRATPARPAPAPAAPASKPSAPALTRLLNNYSLQAGVFASPEKAQELHAMLTLNGIPSTLETRVRVGPFKDKAEADAARAKLKALGVESLMLPPRK